MPLPTATIRTQLDLSLRFADGYATTARVFTVARGFLLYLRQRSSNASGWS
jgi:hypothetical protein